MIIKTVEKYKTALLSSKLINVNNLGLPLVFINSLIFLNGSLDNLVKKIEENDFYHLSQEFEVSI